MISSRHIINLDAEYAMYLQMTAYMNDKLIGLYASTKQRTKDEFVQKADFYMYFDFPLTNVYSSLSQAECMYLAISNSNMPCQSHMTGRIIAFNLDNNGHEDVLATFILQVDAAFNRLPSIMKNMIRQRAENLNANSNHQISDVLNGIINDKLEQFDTAFAAASTNGEKNTALNRLHELYNQLRNQNNELSGLITTRSSSSNSAAATRLMTIESENISNLTPQEQTSQGSPSGLFYSASKRPRFNNVHDEPRTDNTPH